MVGKRTESERRDADREPTAERRIRGREIGPAVGESHQRVIASGKCSEIPSPVTNSPAKASTGIRRDPERAEADDHQGEHRQQQVSAL